MNRQKLEYYGIEFDRYVLPSGGKLYTPVNNAISESDFQMLLQVDSDTLRSDRSVSSKTPLEYGYKWFQQYDPEAPGSDVYFSEAMNQFLKCPVYDKNAVGQFLGMNALAAHVDKNSPVTFADYSWAYKSSRSSYSLVASEAAPGRNVRRAVLSANHFNPDDVLLKSSLIVKQQLKKVLFPQIPKRLWPLLNDNPTMHGVRTDRGLQNVYAYAKGVEEDAELYQLLMNHIDSVNLTLIDQAHPDIVMKARHAAEQLKATARRILL